MHSQTQYNTSKMFWGKPGTAARALTCDGRL